MFDQGVDCPASNTWLFNGSHPGAGKRRLCGVPGNISDEILFLLSADIVGSRDTEADIVGRQTKNFTLVGSHHTVDNVGRRQCRLTMSANNVGPCVMQGRF